MNYNSLFLQLQALLQNEDNMISKMANMSAFLNDALDNINWVGFYIVTNGVLKVGPFQGHPACSTIEKGKGVCGTAWLKNETITVKDVHSFEGHIACDPNSRSEVVIPIYENNEMIAELDIDAPILDRFSIEDVKFLQQCASLIGARN